MGNRRLSRELTLQAMYLSDSCNLPLADAFKRVIDSQPLDSVKEFSQRLVDGITKDKEAIDLMLSRYAENWELKRMAIVDRNILRLAAFEILTELDTPVSVIIDEAIEIAKSYSTQDSGKFVNGILDKVKNERPKK